VPPAVEGGATSAMTLVCAMSGHAVDALVDVVGGSEGDIESTIARAGLDRIDREKREINEMRNVP